MWWYKPQGGRRVRVILSCELSSRPARETRRGRRKEGERRGEGGEEKKKNELETPTGGEDLCAHTHLALHAHTTVRFLDHADIIPSITCRAHRPERRGSNVGTVRGGSHMAVSDNPCHVLHSASHPQRRQLMRAGDQVACQGQILSCRRGQHLQPLLKSPCRTWTSSGPCGQHTSYFNP